MSPRALASAFICTSGCLMLIGAVLTFVGGDACLSMAAGVLMIAAVSLGTAIGIRMQESHEDDARRAEEAEDELIAIRTPDGGVKVQPWMGYVAYPPYAESSSGRIYAQLESLAAEREQLRDALDHDTDTFRRIIGH